MAEKSQLSPPLLVPSKQVSNLPTSTPIYDEDHTRPHQYIDIWCTHCGHKFPVPVYCGYRFCRICSVRRQARVRRRLKWLVNQVEIKRPYGIKHLTLTIASEQDLPAMVKKLISSFRKMRQRAYWKNNVLGGSFVIEITGNPGNWHAHIHTIIEAKFMNWDVLHRLWFSCSGGKGVWISRLSQSKAVGYLTKYLTKSDVTTELMEEMSAALKGTRLFSPFGRWYAINCKYVPPKPDCPNCDNGDLNIYYSFDTDQWSGTYTRYD